MIDALTKYYQARELEESAVLYINDSFLETMNSLEKLEAENEHMRLKDMAAIGELQEENTKLRELVEVGLRCCDHKCDGCKFLRCGLCHVDEFEDEARKLGVEVTG